MKFPIQAKPVARQASKSSLTSAGVTPSSIQCSLCHMACDQIRDGAARAACHMACEHTVC